MIAYLRRALAGYPMVRVNHWGLTRDQECLDRMHNTLTVLAAAGTYPESGTVIHEDHLQLINNVLDYCEEVGYRKRRR